MFYKAGIPQWKTAFNCYGVESGDNWNQDVINSRKEGIEYIIDTSFKVMKWFGTYIIVIYYITEY